LQAADLRGVAVHGFAACVARRATLFSKATGVDRNRMLQWATVVQAAGVMNGRIGADGLEPAETYLAAFLDLALS